MGKSPRITRRGKRFLQSLSFPKSVLWWTSSASQLLYLSVSPCQQSKLFFFVCICICPFMVSFLFVGEVCVWVIWFLFLLIVILAKRSTYLRLIDISFLLCLLLIVLFLYINLFANAHSKQIFPFYPIPFFFFLVLFLIGEHFFFFLSFGPPWVCYI